MTTEISPHQNTLSFLWSTFILPEHRITFFIAKTRQVTVMPQIKVHTIPSRLSKLTSTITHGAARGQLFRPTSTFTSRSEILESSLLLPNEIIVRVFQFLPVLDRLALALTCKHLTSFITSAGVLTFDSTASDDRHFIEHDDCLPIAITEYPVHEGKITGRLWVNQDALYMFSLPTAERKSLPRVVRFPARASIDWWVWNDYLKLKCKNQGLWYPQGLAELVTMKAKIMLEEKEKSRENLYRLLRR